MKRIAAPAVLTAGLLLAACETGVAPTVIDQTAPTRAASTSLRQGGPGDFLLFSPRRQSINATLDYGVWDELLRAVVLDLGPSTRTRASMPESGTGTRLAFGQTSPYRLEGSRVMYEFFNDDILAALTEYRNDLVAIGNAYDIPAMSRNEQLAYWINLHNVILVEAIARKYPVRAPSMMRPEGGGGATLHEAKLITIRGVPLSLSDIRTKIVYPHWRSPEVMYGFFRGDIGGPKLRTRAYTRADIGEMLEQNADEFVNSLRGVSDEDGRLVVSSLYEEGRPFFFKNWPDDLKTHLRRYLKPEIYASIDFDGPLRTLRYETVIADLSGGQPYPPPSQNQVRDATGLSVDSLSAPQQVIRMLQEAQTKIGDLKARGEIGGRVTIVDDPYGEEGEGAEVD